MADLGTLSMLLALALAVYAALGYLAAGRFGSHELAISARRSVYMSTVALAVASGALVYAFLTHDFSIEYVQGHSNRAMDPAYVWVAMYAGNEGSLLYIALVLGVMASAAVYFAPARLGPALPYVGAILMGTLAFFITVTLLLASPFAPLGFSVDDGVGMNPLLRHPGMFIHPPLQMAGLVAVTIPFAFVIGALMAGQTRDQWLDAARVTAIGAWFLLGAGLLVGAWWAYTILGWGGYWGWDPIENVALMPWLVLTAFIHSVMVQKRRGMFRMWNVALLSLAFVLAQFGMFINRGGPVVSVHSFGASTLGAVFLGFMLLSLVFSFGIFLWRYPSLRSDRPLESFLSREASFLVNNFLFLGVTFVTLWGVLFPLFSDLVRDTTVTVSGPWYDKTNGPILLGLIVLMGIGPLLPWRRTSPQSVRKWLLIPTVAALLTAAGLWLSGIRELWAVIGFATLVFVGTGIAEEWYRGTMAQRRAGYNPVRGYWRMVSGNRPRHGGYIVHVAILALALGIVGTTFFQQRADVALAPGESFVLDNYRVEYLGSQSAQRADRESEWASVRVYKDGKLVGELEPWRAFYPVFGMASVRAAIHYTPIVDVPGIPAWALPGLEDLYIVPSDFLDDGRVVFRISINPLAWWLWVSGPVVILGTVIALWPARVPQRRAVPAEPSSPAPQRAGAAGS